MNYLAPDICAACGGKCCKNMPGECHPMDFDRPLDVSLYAAFTSGIYVVDWWEGDPREGMDYDDEDYMDRALYVRVRGHDDGPGVFHPAWFGNQCILLREEGCILAPESRPMSCRMLEPSTEKCRMHDEGGKHTMALAWLPYNDLILEVARRAEHDYGDCLPTI